MALSNTNLSLLALVTLFLMLANKVNSQGSLCFTINEFPEEHPDLTYQGNVQANSGVLRLAKTEKTSVGRVLYTTKIQLFNSKKLSTFKATIKFAITYVDGKPGDGITFFLAAPNTTIPSGSAGGNVGIFSTGGCEDQVVAVEFDIYKNYWDPSDNHIGIDIESRKSVATTPWENVSGQLVIADITYDAKKTLSVSVTPAPKGRRVKQKPYVVSQEIDLRTVLPEYVIVGISGSTGNQVAIFDIHYWKFCSDIDYTAEKEKEDMYIAQYV